MSTSGRRFGSKAKNEQLYVKTLKKKTNKTNNQKTKNKTKQTTTLCLCVRVCMCVLSGAVVCGQLTHRHGHLTFSSWTCVYMYKSRIFTFRSAIAVLVLASIFATDVR